MKKQKILIVGGFPSKHTKIYGGIVTACTTLMMSSFVNKFEIITIDSTQKSNPLPSFHIRLSYAVIRIIVFITQSVVKRPKVIILFPAVGASLVEKGFMSWIAFFLRIPVFMFPRGGALIDQVKHSKFTRLWVKCAFSGASKVICQGPAWKSFAQEILHFSDLDTPIVQNWTATNDLLELGRKKTKIRAKAEQTPVILFLGWLEKEKGIFDFINASSIIYKSGNFKILIAGGGSCEESAKDLVREKNMESVISFLGWVDRNQLKEVFLRSDILVLPSWSEGFPNAVIEAMAAGLAVIVTSVGNVPDILTHNSEVLLVPPKDKDALVKSIEKLINDQELRYRLSLKGHEFAEKNFSIKNAAHKLEQLVNSVLK